MECVSPVSRFRPFLADPFWVRKAAEGRVDEINTCIGCNQACLDHTFMAKVGTVFYSSILFATLVYSVLFYSVLFRSNLIYSFLFPILRSLGMCVDM